MTAWRFPDDGAIVSVENLEVNGRLGLIGPNGAGKTSLLRLMAGISAPTPLGTVSYLPQHPYIFRGSVGKNLSLGLGAEETNHAVQLVLAFGLEKEMLAEPATQLSGGERQRVFLARALARRSDVLLLDEPLTAIAASDRPQMLSVVAESLGGRDVVVVAHDRDELIMLTDRLVVLLDGQVRQQGPIGEVLASPIDLDVAKLLGVSNVSSGLVVADDHGLLKVEVGGATIFGMGDVGVGEPCRVVFAAEAVTVFAGSAEDGGSARNRWPARIVSIAARGRLVEIVADAGFPVTALLTPGSAEAMDLESGAAIQLGIKAVAITVVPG